MLEVMDETMPAGVHWTHPQGGLFLWVTLPEEMDSAQLLKRAIEQKVAFVPGGPFHPCGGGKNTMRLNFSYSRPEVIQQGMVRLVGVIRETVELVK